MTQVNRSVHVPEGLLDTLVAGATGPLVRPHEVARVRGFLQSGGQYPTAAVAACLAEEILGRSVPPSRRRPVG
ncbi:MAG: hypothetical protein ACRD0D_05920 [Acidimicrobiales bacterium]